MSTEDKSKPVADTAQRAAAGSLLREELGHLRSHWWCLLLLGVFLVACGVVALVFPALTNAVAMEVLGITLTVTGVATIITAFWVGKWSGLLVQLLAGILYLVVGLQIAETPVKAGVATAALMAGFFIVVGAFRGVAAMILRFPGWGWSLLNGAVTFLCGVVIYRHFPQYALSLVGLLVGVELLLSGWTWIALALGVRKLPAPPA
jgi:uncharacterized membrane protein HdeD (DUF308 family)